MSNRLSKKPLSLHKRVRAAVRNLGHKRFDTYLVVSAARGLTLKGMAAELGIPSPTFIGYHTQHIERFAMGRRLEG